MTFEEIQQAIEGLLSVQRNLQEGQLRMQERHSATDERLDRLTSITQATDERLDRLTGITQATDERLDRLTGITERYINASTGVIERLDQTVERLDQNIEELRASNEELRASNRRQERINDFLLRRENGASPE